MFYLQGNQGNESFAVPGKLSLTRLPEFSVHLIVSVGRSGFVSSLSGNQLKISDVCKILFRKYLLLTEFEVRTVTYGPIFSPPSIYGPWAKRAGHNS